MVLIASDYLHINPARFFPVQKDIYQSHLIALISHIAAGMVALLIGPFLFCSKKNALMRVLHRRLAYVYLAAIAVSAFAGLYMAVYAYAGPFAQLGFASMSCIWILTAVAGYREIRNGRIQLHRKWMMRNFAVTFAAVTFRLWNGVFQVTSVDFNVGYITSSWLCWTLNLVLLEGYLRWGRKHRDDIEDVLA